MKTNKEDFKLSSKTTLGHVNLTISDLGRSLDFYQRAMGFQVHRQEGQTAYLGTGETDLLVLTEHPGAKLIPKRTVL
ncbi:MAG: VOC family protein [Chloroflexota bacterium]